MNVETDYLLFLNTFNIESEIQKDEIVNTMIIWSPKRTYLLIIIISHCLRCKSMREGIPNCANQQ